MELETMIQDPTIKTKNKIILTSIIIYFIFDKYIND